MVIIQNPNFEADDQSWTFSTPLPRSVDHALRVLLAARRSAGLFSVYVISSTAAAGSASTSQMVNVTPGKTDTLSAWCLRFWDYFILTRVTVWRAVGRECGRYFEVLDKARGCLDVTRRSGFRGAGGYVCKSWGGWGGWGWGLMS